LCFNHDFDKIIGTVDSIEEKENGPFIEASFLDTTLAQDVRKFVQSGAVYQFSFAYDVIGRRNPTTTEKDAGITNVLTEVEVYEVSVVTVPANQNAVVTEIKAGRRNRKSDEDIIKQIISLAESLIDDEADDTTEETEPIEEVEPEVNAEAEEPKDNDNLKKATELLEKINSIKEGSDL
jgi:HK97 family phage prohead protease